MKLFTIFLLLSAPQTFAKTAHEINRRNFLSLNSDLNELDLVVHYPGGSHITEVCGFQLRTSIPVFANAHMEAFIKEIQILDENNVELIASQSVTGPPKFSLKEVDEMSVPFTIKTKSGESFKKVIRKAAESERLKFDTGPEIILMAKHCKDNS